MRENARRTSCLSNSQANAKPVREAVQLIASLSVMAMDASPFNSRNNCDGRGNTPVRPNVFANIVNSNGTGDALRHKTPPSTTTCPDATR
jgi:hypothetical protein